MPPLRTTVVDDHEIDTAGVSSVLGRFSDRITLVDADAPDVDVILYGAREQYPGHDSALHSLLRSSSATVVVLGWDTETPHVAWALACGAHGHLSKTMVGPDLVAGLEQIHLDRDRDRELPSDGECHPALRLAGLTPREQDVLEMIALGLTNQEIAELAFISINSVKTYVRAAYRKIGVTRRSQAVSWGLRAGFTPTSDPDPEPAV